MKIMTRLLVCLLACLGACTPESSTVVLHVSGLSPEMRFFRVSVSVDGEPMRLLQEYAAAPVIGVRMPSPREGMIALSIDGIIEDRCVVGRGRTEGAVRPMERLDMEVTLIELPARLCPLQVLGEGAGGGDIAAAAQLGIECAIAEAGPAGRCAAEVPVGSAISLSAKPDATSYFRGWSGPCSGTGPCLFSLEGRTEVKAQFDKNTLSIQRQGQGKGKVDSEPAGITCGDRCATEFSVGTRVNLSAAPADGSYFSGWSGACFGTGPCALSLSAPATVTATFERNTLTVRKAGSGTGTVSSEPGAISCGPTCSADIVYGRKVVLSARPDAGFYFVGWSGACKGAGTCEITMNRPTEVTANFSKNTFQVSKSGGGGGTVRSTPAGILCGTECSYDFASGTQITLSATPSTGSVFQGFSGACTGPTCTLTLEGPAQVEARFVPVYRVAVGKGGAGGGTVISDPAGIDCGASCAADHASGTKVKLVARADSRSYFAGWSGGCVGLDPCEVTLTAPLSVTATFQPKQCSAAGVCWENPVPHGNALNDIWLSPGGDVWVVGDYGQVMRWNGSTLTTVPSGTTENLRLIWGASATDIWVVGDNGSILRWNGTAFSRFTGVPGYVTAIMGFSANDVWLVGSGIYRWNGSAVSSMPNPTGTTLNAVWGTAANNLWAAGYNGGLIRFDGMTWTKVSTGITQNISALWGSSANDVWAVVDGGKFLHFDGTSWSLGTNPTNVYQARIWGSGANDVWVVSRFWGSLRWNGTAWTQVSALASLRPRGISGRGPSDAWLVTDSGLVRFDGATWKDLGNTLDRSGGYVQAVWAAGPGDVWLSGSQGLLHYVDGQWTRVAGRSATAIWGSGPGNVFFGSYRRISRFDGTSFSDADLPIPSQVNAIWGSSPSNVWAVGSQGAMVRFDGSAWTVVASPTMADLNRIGGTGANQIWAAGNNGAIIAYNGTTWSSVAPPVAGAYVYALWPVASNDLWISLYNVIYRWNGSAWSRLDMPAGASAIGLFAFGPGEVYSVGSRGAVYRYDGMAWRAPINTGTNNYLQQVSGAGGSLFVGGDLGTLLQVPR